MRTRELSKRLQRIERRTIAPDGSWPNDRGGFVRFLPFHCHDDDGAAFREALAAYEAAHGLTGPADTFLLRAEPMSEAAFEAAFNVRPVETPPLS